MNEGAGGGGRDSQRPPKFSIIIPVYNVAPYLRECLDSVLAQTYTDWEAICVDDGSTDDSGAILDEYAAKNRQIKTIHQRNQGVSAARNNAIDMATGEWFLFLDPDDAVDVDWIVVYSNAIREGVDIVRIGTVDWFGDVAEIQANVNRRPDAEYYTNDRSVAEWGWPTIAKYGGIGTYGVRRAVFKGLRFPVGIKHGEDILLGFHLLLRVRGACQLRYRGYHYRQRKDSAVRAAFSDAERKLFFYELEKTRIVIEGCICKEDPNRDVVMRSLRFFYTRSFFAWLSRSPQTLCEVSTKELLRDKIKEGLIVAPDRRFHFMICLWLCSSLGLFFPFRIVYSLIRTANAIVSLGKR